VVRSQWRQSGWSPVGSPVGIGEDLWWEGFVEQVSFKSGMEERESDGWCYGGDRWWTRLTEWSRKNGRLFQRLGDAYRKERSVILREEDESGRAMVMRDDERVPPGGFLIQGLPHNFTLYKPHSINESSEIWMHIRNVTPCSLMVGIGYTVTVCTSYRHKRSLVTGLKA